MELLSELSAVVGWAYGVNCGCQDWLIPGLGLLRSVHSKRHLKMMMTNDQSEKELLRKFKQACIDHNSGTESGDRELTDRATDKINGVVEQLWKQNGQTKEGLRKLSELAQDQDPRIAGKAAAYTINLFPEVATVLKRLKKERSIIGLQAKYALKNWEEGGGIMKTLLNLE